MHDRIEIYRSGLRRKLRWRYVAGNGNILADSGQGYTRRIDAITAAARVTGTRWVESSDVNENVPRRALAGAPIVGHLFGIGGNGGHRQVVVIEVAR